MQRQPWVNNLAGNPGGGQSGHKGGNGAVFASHEGMFGAAHASDGDSGSAALQEGGHMSAAGGDLDRHSASWKLVQGTPSGCQNRNCRFNRTAASDDGGSKFARFLT